MSPPADPFATPDGLRAWLEQQPANAVCGLPGDPCDCPAARYLVAAGFREPYVYPAEWEADQVTHQTPEWLQSFVLNVDDEVPDVEGWVDADTAAAYPLTAARCLTLLGRVTP